MRGLSFGMASRADDQRFSPFRTQRGHGRGRVVKTKIHDDVSLIDDSPKVITQIDLTHNLEFRMVGSTSDERLPHATLRTVDDNSDHFNTPHSFSVAFRRSRFLGAMGTKGRRYSSWICPSIAKAALTGPGLLSMNRSLTKRKYFS